MKTFSYLLMAILFLTTGSCKKQTIPPGNAMGASPPLMYEVLDKNGKSILDTANSLTDSLTLSWHNNGVDSQFSDKMLNLNYLPESAASAALLAGYKKYNGITAVDYNMLALSKGFIPTSLLQGATPPYYPLTFQTTNPVHTFNLSYHG